MSQARPRGTDGSLLASLPWTLAALSIAIAPHVPYLPIWITGAFVACALWRMVIERRRGTLPGTWVRGALALACFLGVLGTYSSISGVGPGSALLAIMAALKLLETRKRRDQFVLLFLSIFLVMSSLLRDQFLWSIPYLAIGTLIIMTAWLRMASGRSQTARRSFATSGRLLLYAAPLAIAMWVFFPRLASPFWAVPIDTSRATTGLSNSMSPGDISSLSQSDEVAFRVSFDGDIPDARDLYWRGLVMTRFNGRTWSGFDPTRASGSGAQIEYAGEPYSYEVTLEATQQQWVFALDMAREWTLSNTHRGPQQQLWHKTPIDQRVAYRAVSYPTYRVQATLSELRRSSYTSVPPESNQEAAELARSMRERSATDVEFIDSVLDKFNREEYFYTLQPPALGRNPVDRFLFDTRQGFCEHYASAFTFMMRSAGIPARIVLGYHGGEVNPMGGHLIVRQSDAHAWSEVWLEGIGWRRVDPTAAVAPERIEFGAAGAALDGIGASWGFSAPSRLIQNLTMTWDALNAKWNDWILGYGPEKQNSLMEMLGMENPSWRKMLLTLVTLVVSLTLLISAMMMLRSRPPKRDAASRLYAQFVKRTGLQLRTGETAGDFSERAANDSDLPAASIELITSAYLRSRYDEENDESLIELESAVFNLR